MPETGPRPRVLHLNDRLSALGGADRHLLAVLAHSRGRAETLLAVGRDDGSLPPEEREAVGPWLRVKGLDRGGHAARGGRAARRRLAELIDSFRPDLVHVHNILDPELIRQAAGAAPALLTVQDHRAFCPGLGKLTPRSRICGQPMGQGCLACFDDPDYGRRMLALTAQRLAALAGMPRLLVLSRYMAGELEANGLDPARITVLPPFVHGLPPLERGEAERWHLFAGRLVERKGVRVALGAATLLREPVPLVVAGDGPLAEEVADIAAASGGRVSFAGWADRARMGQLLAGAASLWLPSLWAEPFGIVGLEALSLGVPVLASRVGGVEDWLAEGQGGALLPPGDENALAKAADGLATDPARAAEQSRRGQVAAARFAPEALMDRLFAIYDDLLLKGPA